MIISLPVHPGSSCLEAERGLERKAKALHVQAPVPSLAAPLGPPNTIGVALPSMKKEARAKRESSE